MRAAACKVHLNLVVLELLCIHRGLTEVSTQNPGGFAVGREDRMKGSLAILGNGQEKPWFIFTVLYEMAKPLLSLRGTCGAMTVETRRTSAHLGCLRHLGVGRVREWGAGGDAKGSAVRPWITLDWVLDWRRVGVLNALGAGAASVYIMEQALWEHGHTHPFEDANSAERPHWKLPSLKKASFSRCRQVAQVLVLVVGYS